MVTVFHGSSSTQHSTVARVIVHTTHYSGTGHRPHNTVQWHGSSSTQHSTVARVIVHTTQYSGTGHRSHNTVQWHGSSAIQHSTVARVIVHTTQYSGTGHRPHNTVQWLLLYFKYKTTQASMITSSTTTTTRALPLQTGKHYSLQCIATLGAPGTKVFMNGPIVRKLCVRRWGGEVCVGQRGGEGKSYV